MIAVGLPNLIDTVRRDESAGVVAAMVAMLPEGTPPDDAEVARLLLARGYTAGMIAEHLDAVIEALIDTTGIDKYGNPIDGSSLPYCCFPDCGCDGARLCMAESGASSASLILNEERGTR